MKIGDIKPEGYACLAPMAGVADRAFRELCRSYGAAFTETELISAKALSLGDKKSLELSRVSQKERPIGIQLFGSDPDVIAAAAEKVSENADFIDINMGCPAPKVAGNGGGAALLRDPRLAEETVAAAVGASAVAVTVKIRSGWDFEHINAVEIAKRCEAAGASAITVHGRTRQQMYAPPVDLSIIAAVKRAVRVPVIGNGDITSGESAADMLEKTGCDFLMIGRAAMGAPWIFSQINAYLSSGEVLPGPPLRERLDVLLTQVRLMLEYKNPRTAILESRKHAAWYLKGVRGAAEMRKRCGEINSYDDLVKICDDAVSLQER